MDIVELQAGAKLDFVDEILGPFDFPAAKKEIVVENFQREMAEIGTNRVILLGTIDGEAVSTVQLVLRNADNNPELANGREIAHVHNLWVRKDLQRRGYAFALMRHCEWPASQRGIQVLTLGVDDFNTGAIALYERLGYGTFAEEEGRTPEEKLFLMRKRL